MMHGFQVDVKDGLVSERERFEIAYSVEHQASDPEVPGPFPEKRSPCSLV